MSRTTAEKLPETCFELMEHLEELDDWIPVRDLIASGWDRDVITVLDDESRELSELILVGRRGADTYRPGQKLGNPNDVHSDVSCYHYSFLISRELDEAAGIDHPLCITIGQWGKALLAKRRLANGGKMAEGGAVPVEPIGPSWDGPEITILRALNNAHPSRLSVDDVCDDQGVNINDEKAIRQKLSHLIELGLAERPPADGTKGSKQGRTGATITPKGRSMLANIPA